MKRFTTGLMFIGILFGGANLALADISFVYSDGVYSVLDVPGARYTWAYGISDNGQVVGNYCDTENGFPVHGFSYSGGTFTTFDAPDTLALGGFIRPQGTNDSGAVVGYFWDDRGLDHGFLYSGGVFTTLDYPGATRTQAFGINDIGQVVGYFADNTGEHGFLYSGGVFSTLDYPGGDWNWTAANGINNNGQIVGNFGDRRVGALHGFLYSGGVFTTLDYPGASNTGASGINDLGQVVGYFDNATGGYVYSASTFTRIAYPGASNTRTFGINDSGQVVGYSVSVPEPSSWILLCLMSSVMLGLRATLRHRRFKLTVPD